MKKFYTFLFIIFSFQTIYSQREVVSINDNWKFSESDSGIWENVNIPHAWNQDDYASKDIYINTVVSAVKTAITYNGTITLISHAGKINIRSRILDKGGNNFSPFAECGNNLTIIKTYIAEVTDGSIAVRFNGHKASSFVNALKIRRL